MPDLQLTKTREGFAELNAARRALHRAEGRMYAHALDVMHFYKTTPGAIIDADLRIGYKRIDPKDFANRPNPMACKVVALINDNAGRKFALDDLDPTILAGMYKHTHGASTPKSRAALAKRVAEMRGVEAVLKFWDECYETDEPADEQAA